MTSNQSEKTNREIVVGAFAEFARGDTGILAEVLHPDFVEHSPGNPSGRDRFIEHILKAPVANAALDLKRVIAGDDLVVLHYCLTPHDDSPALAVVDIWRVADGLIVEHWDVVQPVPGNAETPNGMF
ncbi:nuclear transport factor 2 family protein [Nonomuraea sp. B1E8]|uniref:nuclear transport factor 2 family protein n=1 Tax=unclassified Nonomuraea TaxID=2593643 RepID=UPI00325EC7D6